MGTPVRLAQDASSVQNRPVDLTGLGSLCLCEPSPAGSCQRNWPGCQPATFRAEAAFPVQPLPIHLLDGPAADLQLLGQFPLAHSLRPLCPDILPLLLAQARPSARESTLGSRLSLNRDRALPDRVPPAPLKASTMESWSLPVDVAVSKSSARDRNSTPARCGPSIALVGPRTGSCTV